MRKFTFCPPEAVKAAENICGVIQLEEITNRRGAAVWKATGPSAIMAIKAGQGEGGEITAREAAVLGHLPGCTVASGRSGGGAWYVTPWIAGPSTWDVFQPFREGADGRKRALEGALDLCRAVADLHASGWVHSDLQPFHGIHTEQGVKLIDFAWAWSPDFDQHPAFRGGIDHLASPELAASISLGIQPVKASIEAEGYALAGALWTCITGRWPMDYAAVGLDPRALTPAQIRLAIMNRSIPLDPARPWPVFQDVLRSVLLSRPADRPTVAELAGILEAIPC